MKKLIVTILLAITSCSVWAQGTVNFASLFTGSTTKFTDIDGVTFLSGAAFKAQLYYALGANVQADSLQVLAGNTPTSFLTAANAGAFAGGTKVIPLIPGGSITTIQVRFWRLADGADWETAKAAPGGRFGMSNPLNITLATAPATPPNLVGLVTSSLMVVPEPSTIALGLLGGAFLLFRRRK